MPRPIQNAPQHAKIIEMVDDAVASGAAIIAGADYDPASGNRYPVTLLEGVPASARIMQDECFGPVLILQAYDDLEAAIEAANATPYGLGASVWTGDDSAAMPIAERLDAGSVWINNHADVTPLVPLPTLKQSGLGVEYNVEGLLEFVALKIINSAESRK